MPAQTIKQAKASYKSRGRPTLTNKEQRQLERSLELEARAERAKEAEKRRAETAKKRVESERVAKTNNVKCQMGSQRRTDRFGFKASQFHLGAFFGAGAKHIEACSEQSRPYAAQNELSEDAFEDDGLDDESLLSLLDQSPQARAAKQSIVEPANSHAKLMPPPPLRSRMPTKPKESGDIDIGLELQLNDLWDELDSSTQVARDLNLAEEPKLDMQATRSGSFSSGSLNLTAEDFEELDSPDHLHAPTLTRAAAVMPPPALPSRLVEPRGRPNVQPKTMPTARKPVKAIRGPFHPASSLYCSPDLGFTASQLEAYVDDDIQLTQAVPG